jgi:hypothetical protein
MVSFGALSILLDKATSFLAKWGKQFPYSRFREKCKGLLGSTCVNE